MYTSDVASLVGAADVSQCYTHGDGHGKRSQVSCSAISYKHCDRWEGSEILRICTATYSAAVGRGPLRGRRVFGSTRRGLDVPDAPPAL